MLGGRGGDHYGGGGGWIWKLRRWWIGVGWLQDAPLLELISSVNDVWMEGNALVRVMFGLKWRFDSK